MLRLEAANVDTLLDCEVKNINLKKTELVVEAILQKNKVEFTSDLVFNCCYSNLNTLDNSEILNLDHQLTEMALVEPCSWLADKAVTVMDGPFFSLMPFPARNLMSVSHVRYTPHTRWSDTPHIVQNSLDSGHLGTISRSQYTQMSKDIQRYIPSFSESTYVESLWEIKTMLPVNKVDDGRPILFRRSVSNPGMFSVLGGKIDNVYDALDELEKVI